MERKNGTWVYVSVTYNNFGNIYPTQGTKRGAKDGVVKKNNRNSGGRQGFYGSIQVLRT
jgi:hypothetical protein